MQTLRDEFLSEEDLDLRNMSQDELFAYWDLWLEQAQASNDLDQNTYSHGVFVLEPPVRVAGRGIVEGWMWNVQERRKKSTDFADYEERGRIVARSTSVKSV